MALNILTQYPLRRFQESEDEEIVHELGQDVDLKRHLNIRSDHEWKKLRVQRDYEAKERKQHRRKRNSAALVSDSHLDLIRAPYCYVLYGVKYIDLVSLAPFPGSA